MVRRSRLVSFYFKEKFCVSARVGKSILSNLVEKNISPVIFHTDVTKTRNGEWGMGMGNGEWEIRNAK